MTAKSIEIERKKRLREKPGKGHNRWHPDIAPVMEAAPGEEVTLDANDLQIDADSAKSYDYIREHNEAVNRLDFWPNREAINIDYSEGSVIEVPQHDGSIMKLRKTHPEYDPTDHIGAMTQIQAHAAKGEVLTGLLYVNPDSEDLHAHLNTYQPAFNTLAEKDLCPEAATLEKINSALR